MARSKQVLKPRGSLALYGVFVIIESIISQNLSLGIVGGCDPRSAMDQAMRLVKVDCLSNVVRNDLVPLPRFLDAVDLYREQYRDARAIEIAG